MEKLSTTELVPGSLLEKRHSQLKQLPCPSVAPDFRSFLSRHPLPSHGRRYGRLPGVPGRPQPLRLLPPRLPPQQKATPSTRWRPLRQCAPVGGARASPCDAPAGPGTARGGNGWPNRHLGAAAGRSAAAPALPCPRCVSARSLLNSGLDHVAPFFAFLALFLWGFGLGFFCAV